MKRLLLLFVVLVIPIATFANTVVKIDREKGYYIDGRGQLPVDQCVPPPHPEKVPEMSLPVRTVEPFEVYYDTVIQGKYRKEYMTPIIPNYNMYYSNRYDELFYSKQQFLDVWCSGKQHDLGADCVTDKYAFIYGKVTNWAPLVTSLPFRTLKAKAQGKKPALVLMVNEIATDSEYISGAREWAELYGTFIAFVTIDCMIPSNNIAI